MTRLEDLDGWSESLYSAVVADVCDAIGLRDRVVSADIRPVLGHRKVLIGWARTARAEPVSFFPDPPYAAEVAFLDSLGPGDVVVATTGHSTAAFWGELFSTAAVGRGARGAVIDGFVRDQLKIHELRFPVFAAGGRPADSHGRLSIVEQDLAVSLGGTVIEPGDLVVADADGLVAVPKSVSLHVTARALEKVAVENAARDLLLGGAKLADVWERYRVL